MERISLIVCLCFAVPGKAWTADAGEQDSLARRQLERARILYERLEYDSLPHYYGSACRTFDRLGDHEGAAECILGMVDCHRMLDRQHAASSMMDSAESYILSKLGRRSVSWADALYTRAKLYTGQNRNREAIELLESCLELHKELEAEAEKTASVYNVLGAAFYTLGDMDNSEDNYRKALDIRMENSLEPSAEKGNLLFNLGLVYSRRNDQQKWAEYIMQGINNQVLLFGPDYPVLSGYYNALSSYYITAGRLDSARHYLDRAEGIMRKAFGDDYHELSRIYINRARIYRYEGDYRTSLEYYMQALRMLESQEIPRKSLEYSAYLNMASLYYAQGDYETSREYLLKLLDAEGRVHPTQMAGYYSSLGSIHIDLGRYREARDYFGKAFGIKDRYLPPDHYSLVYDYRVYGSLMDSLGRHALAEEYFNKALEIALKHYGSSHISTARANLALGDHYARAGNYSLALRHYQDAIRNLVPDYNTENPGENPDPDTVTNLLFYVRILKQKGRALESMAQRAGSAGEQEAFTRHAFRAYNTSVRVIGKMRNSYLTDESRLYLSQYERSTHEKGVRLAYRCYRLSSDAGFLAEAFRIAEKAKYATLQSVLQREEALDLSGIPDSVRSLEADLKKQLSVYRELLMESQADTLPDQVQLQRYRNEIFRLSDRIATLNSQLEEEYPDYYQLLHDPWGVDPEGIQRNLGRRDELIEYFIAGPELYIFEISRGAFRCRKDTIDGSMIKDLELVRDFLTRHSVRDTVQDAHLAFIESATELHRRLIPPSGEFRNLIIVPEGRLSYLPFDILISGPVSDFDGRYDRVPFLIRSHTLRYGYSASLLIRQGRRSPAKPGHFLGFAPGYLSPEGRQETPEAYREIKVPRSTLIPLPESIEEVNAIEALLGGEAYTGTDASEGRFKRLAGESHIIHLATHAFLDDRDPLKSTLVFAENPREDEDGFLKVYELYDMDLEARMVVLSACNTGIGEMLGGEGFMSLARAFYYAGVPNIVLTLWTVSDHQSHQLMLSFYEQLRRGRRAEVSLQKAKLEYLDSSNPGEQHPRYWAGYILLGNPGSLVFPHTCRWIMILTGSVILVILAVLLGIRPGRNRRVKSELPE